MWKSLAIVVVVVAVIAAIYDVGPFGEESRESPELSPNEATGLVFQYLENHAMLSASLPMNPSSGYNYGISPGRTIMLTRWEMVAEVFDPDRVGVYDHQTRTWTVMSVGYSSGKNCFSHFSGEYLVYDRTQVVVPINYLARRTASWYLNRSYISDAPREVTVC